MEIESPETSGLSVLQRNWQEKEKYAILFLWIKTGGVCMAEKMAEQMSTGCPAPLYLPLSEFVNTDGTI